MSTINFVFWRQLYQNTDKNAEIVLSGCDQGKQGLRQLQKIFKILRAGEWHDFKKSGHFMGSPVDLKDGFIHFSYADQLGETARRHFAGCDDLVLLAVDPAGLGPALRAEISRGGALFPHLFAPLSIDDVVWDRPIGRDAAGMPVLPVLDPDTLQGTP